MQAHIAAARSLPRGAEEDTAHTRKAAASRAFACTAPAMQPVRPPCCTAANWCHMCAKTKTSAALVAISTAPMKQRHWPLVRPHLPLPWREPARLGVVARTLLGPHAPARSSVRHACILLICAAIAGAKNVLPPLCSSNPSPHDTHTHTFSPISARAGSKQRHAQNQCCWSPARCWERRTNRGCSAPQAWARKRKGVQATMSCSGAPLQACAANQLHGRTHDTPEWRSQLQSSLSASLLCRAVS